MLRVLIQQDSGGWTDLGVGQGGEFGVASSTLQVNKGPEKATSSLRMHVQMGEGGTLTATCTTWRLKHLVLT